MGQCYHCKKTGHLIVDCPSLQVIMSRKKHKKKAMVATWDDSEIESKEKVDITNVCFMANGDEASKVTFEKSLDEDNLIWMHLLDFFEELLE